MSRAFLHSPRLPLLSQLLALGTISLAVWPFVVAAETTNYTYNDIAEIPSGTFNGQWDVLRPNDKLNTTVHSSNTKSDTFAIYFRGSAIFIFGGYGVGHALTMVQVNGSDPDIVNTTSSLPPTSSQELIWSRGQLREGDHQLMITNGGPNDRGLVDRKSVIALATGGRRLLGFLLRSAAASIPLEAPILDDTHPRISYSDAWEAWGVSWVGADMYRFTMHVCISYNCTANFTFDGTAIWLYGPLGPLAGSMYVSLDDETPDMIAQSRSVWLGQQLLWSRDNLTDKQHTMTIQNKNALNGMIDFLRYLPSQSAPDGGTSGSGGNSKQLRRVIISVTVLGALVAIVVLFALLRLVHRRWSRSRKEGDTVGTEHPRDSNIFPISESPPPMDANHPSVSNVPQLQVETSPPLGMLTAPLVAR